MKKVKYKILILLILFIGLLFFSGCASNITSSFKLFNDHQPLVDKEYTILGTVRIAQSWYGIIGVSIFDILGISLPLNIFNGIYLVQFGGITYSDLLAEARLQYLGADAVINITADCLSTNGLFSIVFAHRKIILTGIAIKYER